MPWDMRVVPLFETLDDLEQSEATLRFVSLLVQRGFVSTSYIDRDCLRS